MTTAQARDAHNNIKTTLERVCINYAKQYSGRTVMGKTVFCNRVSQREYDALVKLSEIMERLTPEQIAGIMSGERVTIPAAGKQAKTGEPDLNFTPMFTS